jgi:hypothetical protein
MRKTSCGKVLSLLMLALAYGVATPSSSAANHSLFASTDVPGVCQPATGLLQPTLAGMPAPMPMLIIQPGQRPPAPGDPGNGGGCASTTCAVQCSDGSWSSIGCNSNEYATCSCSGSPVLANPRCTPC